MDYKFADAVIDVTKLRAGKNTGFVFGFEVKPTDGTPYRSGYIEASHSDSAAQIIHAAYQVGNLQKYQNSYGL